MSNIFLGGMNAASKRGLLVYNSARGKRELLPFSWKLFSTDTTQNCVSTVSKNMDEDILKETSISDWIGGTRLLFMNMKILVSLMIGMESTLEADNIHLIHISMEQDPKTRAKSFDI